ncbi:MAG: hypothetical protein K8R86_09915 [Bacteroidales bacterium]|nr:hypothetical protein [Bacteroidales bacterium]
MKKIVLLLVVMFSATLFVSTYAQDVKKEAKVVTVKGEDIEKTRGISPYIKTPKPVDDEVVVPKPEEKEKARADYCKVIIDNWTGYSIDVYVDGDYAGTVAAWSDGYTWAIEGKTQLYAETVGGTVYFGPTYVDCYYEHTWKLTN